MLMVSAVLMSAVTATMAMGKTKRMPKTAIKMPTVKNSLRQNALMSLSTPALTTALSNERLISKIANTKVIQSAAHRPMDVDAPHQAAKAKQTALNA
jgi:hypothetical protein